MDNTIVQLIGSLGFPIAACIWLATVFKKSIDANTESNNKISIVLAKICEHLNIT